MAQKPRTLNTHFGEHWHLIHDHLHGRRRASAKGFVQSVESSVALDLTHGGS